MGSGQVDSRRARNSLASNYLLFSVAIFSFLMVIAVGFALMAYKDKMQQKHRELPAEAMRIDSVFTDTLDYIAKYTEFVGARISETPENHYSTIAALFGGRLNRPQEYNFFITTFDWVTPDGQMRVSSNLGVLPKPIDMSDRDYIHRAKASPWTLQVSDPRFGGLSKQWIIPAGMGVASREGKFLGTITMGFTLTRMAERIGQMLGSSDARYLIVNEKMQLVLDPHGENNHPISNFALPGIRPAELTERSGFLPKSVSTNGVDYAYYKRMNHYPYLVLVGYEHGFGTTVLSNIVLSRTLGVGLIGMIALVMLGMMKRRLIKPVMQLARKASAIAQGEAATINESGIVEIDLLGEQLCKIGQFLQNERHMVEELAHKTELLELKTNQLESAHQEALNARDAAIRADRAKSDFLANMSHEIRTPMNAIVGLTNILLMKEHAPEAARRYLNTMQISAHQLLELINDLLDIAKLETQSMELETRPVDLREVLEEVVRIGEVKASEKGLPLRVEYPTGERPLVMTDVLRLRQVLMNLVSNAIKFTECGAVTVSLEERIEDMLVHVRITVTDTGIGIPAEKLSSIFDKFSQADASITRRYGGTGLGLSISRNLIELMGGTLSVESTFGQGARFHCDISLPKARREPTHVIETVVNLPAPPLDLSPPAPHCRVLLVEDNPANILVATSVLESLGYSYVVAKNGQDAVNRRFTESFDIVLMDVQMPQMDGLNATRRIRAEERRRALPRIPIIGITAYALIGDRERCLDAGMDDHLPKPFGLREITAMLLRFNAAHSDRKEAL